jgi:hypothetical protein
MLINSAIAMNGIRYCNKWLSEYRVIILFNNHGWSLPAATSLRICALFNWGKPTVRKWQPVILEHYSDLCKRKFYTDMLTAIAQSV